MWIDEIKNYKPKNMQEECDKEQILKAYAIFGNSLLTILNTFIKSF